MGWFEKLFKEKRWGEHEGRTDASGSNYGSNIKISAKFQIYEFRGERRRPLVFETPEGELRFQLHKRRSRKHVSRSKAKAPRRRAQTPKGSASGCFNFGIVEETQEELEERQYVPISRRGETSPKSSPSDDNVSMKSDSTLMSAVSGLTWESTTSRSTKSEKSREEKFDKAVGDMRDYLRNY